MTINKRVARDAEAEKAKKRDEGSGTEIGELGRKQIINWNEKKKGKKMEEEEKEKKMQKLSERNKGGQIMRIAGKDGTKNYD